MNIAPTTIPQQATTNKEQSSLKRKKGSKTDFCLKSGSIDFISSVSYKVNVKTLKFLILA